MYRIPENYNIDSLKGEIISQIAFGVNCFKPIIAPAFCSKQPS